MLRPYAALFVWMLATQPLHSDETNERRAELDGFWTITELTVDGKKWPIRELSDDLWFRTNGKTWRYSFVMNNKRTSVEFAVDLNSEASPMAVDARPKSGAFVNGVCKGIYQLDGDTLTLCLGEKPGLQRPVRFDAQAGSLMLFVMRRDRSREAIDKSLARKLSFAVEVDTLERTINTLLAKVKMDDPQFAIEIITDDLKFDGITKNQTLRNLKMEDKSVAEILTAIVIKANQVPSVRSPADPKQRLVWAIGRDPSDAQRRIVLVTTRSGLKSRGDALPEEFEVKE